MQKSSYYYDARNRGWLARWLIGSERTQVAWELQTGEGAVHATALAILQSSSRARSYWNNNGEPSHQLSAYVIALGIDAYSLPDSTLYTLSKWSSKGFHWTWANAIGPAAEALGLSIIEPEDYIRYTEKEFQRLSQFP